MAQELTSPEPKKRAPALYCIVAFKLIKGIILLLVALSIFALAGKDLQDMFEQLVQRLGFDPENRFFSNIGDWLDTVTPTNMRVVASGTFLCGMFLIVLGLGLAFRAKWAIWLAIGESAFFIPIEVFELIHRHLPRAVDHPRSELFGHPRIGMSLVLAVNVAIVWYLFENRQRLFRHHH